MSENNCPLPFFITWTCGLTSRWALSVRTKFPFGACEFEVNGKRGMNGDGHIGSRGAGGWVQGECVCVLEEKQPRSGGVE